MTIKPPTICSVLSISIFLFLCLTVSAQNNHFKGYSVAGYVGEAYNITFKQKSDVEFKILSIDRQGNVSATLRVKSGPLLSGYDILNGSIDGNGVLRVSGKFSQWQISIAATTNGSIIKANYKLTGADTQEGNFTVTITEEEKIPPTQNNQKGCSRYEGGVTNTSYNQKGKGVIEVLKVDNDGTVTVRFTASNGLSGDGTLVGKFDSENVLRLSGSVSGYTMDIAARTDSNGRFIANYVLSSAGSKQNGNFDLQCTNYVADAQPQNPVVKEPVNVQPQGNGESINGSWKGTYTCQQGLTNFVLSLFTKDGTNVDGIFTFSLGDGANMSVLGSLKMKGIYDNRNGKIDLKGVDWDQKPAGWEIGDLSGTVKGRNMFGNVTKPAGCKTFQLEKIKF